MISVFTPTYNRGSLISRVYESLERQTNKDFEWIIVDDGSTDDTENIVAAFQEMATFPIAYKKKCNEGKHVAINVGSTMANGEWFFIVDSDDTLTPDAIEKIEFYCDEIKYDTSFSGVVGLRRNAKGEAWTKWYSGGGTTENVVSDKYLDATCLEYRYKYRIQGDRAEVVRTELLKKYPFPQYDNEKFLVESYLWLSLAKDGYKFRWFNDVIYITEYLEDGLTQNISKHYRNSPRGSCAVANLRLSCKGVPLMERVKNTYYFFKYGRIAKERWRNLIKECNCRRLIPVGILLALIKP